MTAARTAGELTELAGRHQTFTTFVIAVEPRLRQALVARYGRERGREAAAEALAWGWQHWDRVVAADNSIGLLYRVGQSRSRPRLTRTLTERPAVDDHLFEPALEGALAELTERERVALLLIHGAGWTHAEVATLLGIKRSTVQKHVERGRARLRIRLGVDEQ